MRITAVVLVALLSLLPGCFSLVGMTVGGSRAAAHNDEIARKLERGERLDPDDADDQPRSVGASTATGLAIGALLDVGAFALVTATAFSHWSSEAVNSHWGAD